MAVAEQQCGASSDRGGWLVTQRQSALNRINCHMIFDWMKGHCNRNILTLPLWIGSHIKKDREPGGKKSTSMLI